MSARPTHRLEASWPIEDPTMPLEELKSEAAGELRMVFARDRLRLVGNVGWSISHGATPTLNVTARVIAS